MMSLPKQEKKFWQRFFRIENLNEIPVEWNTITGMGTEEDDNYFYFISLRVSILRKIDLKDTLVTDEGVQHMTNFKELAVLNLRKHEAITKESILYFNQMQSLESLDITKTSITLADLCERLNNQHLKEVFISSDTTDIYIEEMAFILKERMPGCDIYLDTCFTTDVFDNPIKPIF